MSNTEGYAVTLIIFLAVIHLLKQYNILATLKKWGLIAII